MTASHGAAPFAPRPEGDAGAAALVAALEGAPACIWCFSGSAETPLWANARARAVSGEEGRLPVVGGRPVAELVALVVRSGRSETVSGGLGSAGTSASAFVRPVPVSGAPGALVLIESADDPVDPAIWPGVEADVVGQVQSSLLPPSLPLLPDLLLSGSYHQASSVRSAGGDWYDVVPLGEGRLALVVGDAVGHGVPAAGAMGRLRGALRSTTLRDPSPAAVLAGLDGVAAQMPDVEGASVFYGLLDVATGRLTYAVAGHPAPLMVREDGDTVFLPVSPRPPLGTPPDAGTEVHECVLAQGATVVLFSDGAVAGSPEGPAHGLARLAEVARRVVTEPGALDADATTGLAVAIAERVHAPDDRPDDVAVLVAHRRAGALEPLRVELPAVPSSLPVVRKQLSTWLANLGLGEHDRVGVMVAAGEACANAAEHAYRDAAPGPMRVGAAVDVDGLLTVTVSDDGTWRPPDRDPGDRGRGLLIMRQLVDEVTLEGDRGTTVVLRLRLRHGPDTDEEAAAADGQATVVVNRSGGRPVVVARGEVDETSAEGMRIRLLEASHGGTVPVELDLSDVLLFSSSGVRVVLAVARIAREGGWRLVVHAPERGVTRHILEISGLSGLVDLR